VVGEVADDDVLITDSGGRMVRVREPKGSTGTPPVEVDLSVLEDQRRVEEPGPYRRSGEPPYFAPGTVVGWYWGRSAEVLRVVRDDERGLVGWLPSGSEVLVAVPRDGRGLRDRPLAERVSLEYDMGLRTWRGPGVLRIAPTGRPWSVWYFWNDEGGFERHYVNLELPHERPVSGEPRVHSRDLALDLWLEGDLDAPDVWLKDEDELDAAVEGGRYTDEQGRVIRAIGEQVRHQVVAPRAWPLDEGWESWHPPPGWDEPLVLPDTPTVREARARA